MKHPRFYPIVAVALAVAAIWAMSPPSMTDGIEKFLTNHEIPGAVVAIGRPGERPEIAVFGLAGGGDTAAMTADRVHPLSSLSKPLTAATVLTLARDGRIELDDLLVELRPEAQAAADPRYAMITVRDLLRHSGGWDSDQSFDPFFLDRDALEHQLGIVDAHDCTPVAVGMLDQPLQFTPGDRYAYSNLGYCWLGLIVEAVTGLSYEEAVNRHVLSQFESHGFELGGAAPCAAAAAAMPMLNLSVLGAAGGWSATAEDYFRFAAKPVEPIVRERPRYETSGTSNYYGLGWRVWPSREGAALTHFGSSPGTFSFVMRTPNDHIAVALFNGRPDSDDTAFTDLYEIFLGAAR